jgi:uncharacterized protein (DUF924 family)
MDSRAEEVLGFWFAGDAAARGERWFNGGDAVDAECRERFGGLVEAALRGELDHWTDATRGSLALLVLLDQLTRNVFRGSPRAFAGDVRALEISEALRASGRERELTLGERYVALLPTMHAEDAAVQRSGVEGYRALLADAVAVNAPEDEVSALRSAVDYAKRHLVIIERFGRFPHRNAVLDRASTAEELEFLKGPNSSF